jgi:hypothetical protein
MTPVLTDSDPLDIDLADRKRNFNHGVDQLWVCTTPENLLQPVQPQGWRFSQRIFVAKGAVTSRLC